MRIGSREIGPGRLPYVIAEIGVNHDGDVGRALELTDAAAEAGADAVKLQYFETDRLMSKAAKLAAYQKAAGETDPVTMLRRLELSLDACARVIERAHERGIHAIVTVFSLETVEKTLALPWDAIKTASPDVVNKPLLEALASDGRPMIVSTGAASRNEVQWTYHGVLEEVSGRLVMMQCVSSYPTAREQAAISGLLDLDIDLLVRGGAVGYSDHTAMTDTGALAVRIGAAVLEKHLTYDRAATGPDHAASLDAEGFGEYVRLAKAELVGDALRTLTDIDEQRRVAAMVRDEPAYGLAGEPTAEGGWNFIGCKRVQPVEVDVRRVSRQSVVATRAIATGVRITRDMLTIKRPCDGAIPAADLDAVVGQESLCDVDADTPVPRDAVRETSAMVSFAEVEPAEWTA